MARVLYKAVAVAMVGALCAPASAIDLRKWSDADIQSEIEAAFTFSIFHPVTSLQRHALACGDTDTAVAVEAKLIGLAARVPLDMGLTVRKLRVNQDMAGVTGMAKVRAKDCEPATLADRKVSTGEALNRLDAIITEWERRNR